MKRVVITGGNGTIGSALRNNLTGVEIDSVDQPNADLRDESAFAVMADADVIVHLAHGDGESFRSETFSSDNARMVANVYAWALKSGARVIMASSVHADHCTPQPGGELLTTNTLPTPDSPYGANKVLAEALGRHYAARGVEVVAIRFGGVNKADAAPSDDEMERRMWLSHRDCAALVKGATEADSINGGYVCVYAISNNDGRFHDIANPFGWVPVDGSTRA